MFNVWSCTLLPGGGGEGGEHRLGIFRTLLNLFPTSFSYRKRRPMCIFVSTFFFPYDTQTCIQPCAFTLFLPLLECSYARMNFEGLFTFCTTYVPFNLCSFDFFHALLFIRTYELTLVCTLGHIAFFNLMLYMYHAYSTYDRVRFCITTTSEYLSA